MTKSKAPVSSFGPELQNALRAGANEKIILVFDTPQLAVRFAARINALRSAMRREKHRDTDQLYRAGVSIPKENPCSVVIAPKDSEFRTALKAAGLDSAPLPIERVMDVPTPQPGTEHDPANNFLASLTIATTIPPRPKDEKVDDASNKNVDPTLK